MENKESSDKPNQNARSRSKSAPNMKTEEQDPELETAASQEEANQPEVFEPAANNEVRGNDTNRSINAAASIAQFLTLNSQETQQFNQQHSTTGSLKRKPRILPELPDASRRGTNNDAMFSGVSFNRQIVSSGSLGPNVSFRIERIGPSSEVERTEEVAALTEQQVRTRRKKQSQRGFDCMFLPDHRWKFGYRIQRDCRLLVNHFQVSETQYNGDGELKKDVDDKEDPASRLEISRVRFAAPNDGQPFDMFSEPILRKALNYFYYRQVLKIIYETTVQLHLIIGYEYAQLAVNLKYFYNERFWCFMMMAMVKRFVAFLQKVLHCLEDRVKRQVKKLKPLDKP